MQLRFAAATIGVLGCSAGSMSVSIHDGGDVAPDSALAEQQLPSVTPDATAPLDASVPDAVTPNDAGSSIQDASIDHPDACAKSQCLTGAKSCADACATTSGSCQTSCANDNTCKNNCKTQEQTCKGTCSQYCNQCVKFEGCGTVAQCATAVQ